MSWRTIMNKKVSYRILRSHTIYRNKRNEDLGKQYLNKILTIISSGVDEAMRAMSQYDESEGPLN